MTTTEYSAAPASAAENIDQPSNEQPTDSSEGFRPRIVHSSSSKPREKPQPAKVEEKNPAAAVAPAEAAPLVAAEPETAKRPSNNKPRPAIGSLGARLSELRGKVHMNIETLAQHSGVSKARIEQFETTATKRPGQDTLEKLAKALEVTVDDLLAEPSTPRTAAKKAAEKKAQQAESKTTLRKTPEKAATDKKAAAKKAPAPKAATKPSAKAPSKPKAAAATPVDGDMGEDLTNKQLATLLRRAADVVDGKTSDHLAALFSAGSTLSGALMAAIPMGEKGTVLVMG